MVSEAGGPGSDSLAETIGRLAEDAIRLAAGSGLEPEAEEIARRYSEPLRVAIAGRIKAGKSTLLNALVGERLAATDASECTRIVTWYRNALGYSVVAELRTSAKRELSFKRRDGELDVELGQLSLEAIERIEVGWPSQKLADITLIDTPGLGSTDQRISERTTEALLDSGEEGLGQADAVIYLMRHMHRSDAQFLEAFADRSVAHASPINAIVVLSRADEIGAARPDAIDSARTIAERYAADRRVSELASAVVPIAGLIAETAATLREQEFGWLGDIAALDEDRREVLLRSVDHFRDPEFHPHGSEIREELLRRLGIFGLRQAVSFIATGRTKTASELSQALLELSGIGELQRLLRERYQARAQVLKARTALAGLRSIADQLERRETPGASNLVAEIERVEASSQEIVQLRLLHLVLTGHVNTTGAERAEVDRLCGSGSPAERVGLAPGATADEIRVAALKGVEYWRARIGNPLADRPTVEAAEIISRAYEEIYSLGN